MLVNLDAKWLLDLAHSFEGRDYARVNGLEGPRLRQIAQNLQRLDELNGAKGANGFTEYDRGYKAAMNAIYRRSNIVTQVTHISPESGEIIVAAIASGKLHRVEQEKKPAPVDKLAELGIEIDL